MNNTNSNTMDAKKTFKECGTCSRTFGHLLNCNFAHPHVEEEAALNPLAGGIMNEGHQCGMLWGSALAAGTESYKRHQDKKEAMAVTITATQHIIDSFINRTHTVNCREIIGYNLNTVYGMVAFMLKTTLQGMNNSKCFNLAEKWAPEAIQSAEDGLNETQTELKHEPVSCASIVAEKMGASDEEQVMVSGFAGGLGLSGNGCGALSAAIWMKMLQWVKENPGKNPPFFNNPSAKQLLKVFKEETSSEMLCSKITGQKFSSLDDHAAYIQTGGCKQLMDVLAKA